MGSHCFWGIIDLENFNSNLTSNKISAVFVGYYMCEGIEKVNKGCKFCLARQRHSILFSETAEWFLNQDFNPIVLIKSLRCPF